MFHDLIEWANWNDDLNYKFRSLQQKQSQVKSEDGFVTYEMDMPGIKKSDVKVEPEGSVLKISGKTGTRSYQYLATIPAKYDILKTAGKLEDGILSLKIPKRDTEKIIPIQIE